MSLLDATTMTKNKTNFTKI